MYKNVYKVYRKAVYPNSTSISYQECQSLYNALIIAIELYLMTAKLVSSIVYSIPCSF